MPRTLLTAALAAALLTVAPGSAAADSLAADVSHIGTVNLAYLSSPGAQVSFAEQDAASRVELGTATASSTGFAVIFQATPWRCDRLLRRFTAQAVTADGTTTTGSYDVATPSCRERFSVAAPARVARRGLVTVAVADRWALGDVPAQLCLGQRRLRCQTLHPGEAPTLRRVRAGRSGDVRIVLRAAGFTTRRSVAIGRPAAPEPVRPLVLTTGDSSVQGIEGFLADRLSTVATVRSQFIPGTGISMPGTPGWPMFAARQAGEFAPRATVISVGANEGFDMRTSQGAAVACCGASWEAEFARRERAMVVAYARDGKGRVLWLTLPVPRDPRRAQITAAVNRATARAALGLPEVTVVPLDAVISPQGRFAESIVHRGRRVVVREPDGIHLSPGGTRIAADVVAAALRSAGVVGAKR